MTRVTGGWRKRKLRLSIWIIEVYSRGLENGTWQHSTTGSFQAVGQLSVSIPMIPTCCSEMCLHFSTSFDWGIRSYTIVFTDQCFIAGIAIKCFVCNSFHQADCADWFDNVTQHLVNCPGGATKCRKVVQEGKPLNCLVTGVLLKGIKRLLQSFVSPVPAIRPFYYNCQSPGFWW